MSAEGKSYKVYTRRYDRTISASELDEILGPIPSEYRAAYDEACKEFEFGLAAWRTKLDIACVEAGAVLKAKMQVGELHDTVVSFLIDQSGSMKGQHLLMAAATMSCLTDFLASLGVKVEVLGFTTASWKGGHHRRRWRWWRTRHPGRLCELLHVVYREADTTNPGVPWCIRQMLRPDLPKENVDGEAVEWASKRLEGRPERRRLLIVLSDGAPVDDSTILANGVDLLPDHLRDVVRNLEAVGNIAVGAVDICSGHAEQFYTHTTKVDFLDELGTTTLDFLTHLLTSSNRVERTSTP